MQYPHLFEPIRLNQVLLRNRIVSTAHAEVYGQGGAPSARYIRYYEEKARGGLGLAICGGSSPVSRDSPWQAHGPAGVGGLRVHGGGRGDRDGRDRDTHQDLVDVRDCFRHRDSSEGLT
ncbi:hypothetical protein ET532_026260 [Verminephrobacter sp. Larva24]|nr:hypothetical protein ET532_026260 [Verminephrobacter sp. Larva24]